MGKRVCMCVGKMRLSTAISGSENSCPNLVSYTHNSPFLTHALAGIFRNVLCAIFVSCGRDANPLLNLPYYATL